MKEEREVKEVREATENQEITNENEKKGTQGLSPVPSDYLIAEYVFLNSFNVLTLVKYFNFLSFSGHKDKPTIVRYHPIASNLLASASLDLSIKLWDLEAEKCVITLQGHEEPVNITKYSQLSSTF